MAHPSLSAEHLYQQGLEHFRRAEWRAAIERFTALQALGDHYPEVDELLADAEIKLRFAEIAQPAAMAPPRRPIRLAVFAALSLLLVAASVYSFLALSAPPQLTVAAAQPTAPTAPPTATPVPPTPTPRPTATAQPTAAALLPATVVVTAADDATFVNTPANIEIIVDASGSMLAQAEGSDKQRWQVAQEALTTLINSGAISERSYVVVRTYGRRRGNDCTDLEVAQGLSRFNAESLSGVIAGITPAIGGMTPLGASLHAAADDLQAAEGSTAVILVTDGLESCNGDPVAEALTFAGGSDQRKVHVIGFTIDQQDARDKLRQIAEAGKGLYFDAGSSAQLAEALRQTIVLSYQIFDAEGEQVGGGTVGGAPLTLQPGRYQLKINANPAIEKELVVESGGQMLVSLRQGFGGLIAEIRSASQ
jgi:hypothetical protein